MTKPCTRNTSKKHEAEAWDGCRPHEPHADGGSTKLTTAVHNRRRQKCDGILLGTVYNMQPPILLLSRTVRHAQPTQTSYACLSSAGQSLSQAMPAPQHVYSSCIDNCSPARLAWTVIGWSAWLRISNIPLLRQSRREKLEQRGGIGLGALCGNCK